MCNIGYPGTVKTQLHKNENDILNLMVRNYKVLKIVSEEVLQEMEWDIERDKKMAKNIRRIVQDVLDTCKKDENTLCGETVRTAMHTILGSLKDIDLVPEAYKKEMAELMKGCNVTPIYHEKDIAKLEKLLVNCKKLQKEAEAF